jgi:uncharacterized membrane protein
MDCKEKIMVEVYTVVIPKIFKRLGKDNIHIINISLLRLFGSPSSLAFLWKKRQSPTKYLF